MGAQAKRDAGATPRPTSAPLNPQPSSNASSTSASSSRTGGALLDGASHDDEQAVLSYVVAPGRSLQVDTRTLGPGAAADVDDEDVEWLLATGFIVEVGAVADAGGGVSVGGLTILGGRQTGSKVR